MPLHEQERLLRICRAVMPGVAGVVLSTLTGSVVAHEAERVQDPDGLARAALSSRIADTSTLVPGAGGLYLVVFVEQPPADPSPSCDRPALAA